MTAFCPTCYLPKTDTDQCVRTDFGFACPPLRQENPDKDITLRCGPCEFTRIVPVADLLSGKAKNELPRCQRDDCQCAVVPPEPPKKAPAKTAPSKA